VFEFDGDKTLSPLIKAGMLSFGFFYTFRSEAS